MADIESRAAMFRLDDRAGNVVTTLALFLAAAAIVYLARGAFLILLVSLLFAYLLEPLVTWIQHHPWLGKKNRTWAIAQVYLVGTLVLGSLGYEYGPHLAAQIKNLNAAVPEILEGFSSGKAPVGLGAGHGLNASQQLRVQQLVVRHRDFIVHALERGASSAASVAENAIWLLAIPILAIFILRDGRQMRNGSNKAVEARGDRKLVMGILQRVDTMLAKYIRAQLALAGLSFVFYSVSMFALGFPHALALGLLGGVLEFLPAVGWIASAVAILAVGFLTHSHWIWMAVLVVLWRLVQNFVNSPHVMGDNLELQPLTVIFALMVGGQVAGIAGVYLSVPAVAVLRIVWLECFSTQNSPVALSHQPLVRVRT
jgi:predicted PurR-regulated permease PerM